MPGTQRKLPGRGGSGSQLSVVAGGRNHLYRTVGISPQDRALNYSAMNAYHTTRIFKEMAKEKMRLDTVAVDRSTICRPDSDCWDVTYRFFNPTDVLQTARKVWQYTIDVSDVVPVPVGDLRNWEVY